MQPFTYPIPISEYKHILLTHGSGGKLSKQLVREMFRREFENPQLAENHDGAILDLSSGRVAFSADSFVVNPHFFPGGNIGSLAVHGTLNNLAMCGARPRFLSLSFILAEGFEMEALWLIVCSIEIAATEAGVKIVTGDTKVVERGKCDGIYINTAGIGEIVTNTTISPSAVKAGDSVILSGEPGLHGMSVLSTRHDMKREQELRSDSTSLVEPVMSLLNKGVDVHCFRDPMRGGLASALHDIAADTTLSIMLFEDRIPTSKPVLKACKELKLNHLHLASAGCFLAFVPAGQAKKAIRVLRTFDVSKRAAIIGHVDAKRPGTVVLKRDRDDEYESAMEILDDENIVRTS